jgi:outer membrane protein TolC
MPQITHAVRFAMILRIFALVTLALIALNIAPNAWSTDSGSFLTLQDYIHQVKLNNDGIKGPQASSEGSGLRSKEGTLLLAPTAFITAQTSRDLRETLSSSFQGTQTSTAAYSLGLSKLTTFGLQAKLSYNLHSTSISGASPALVTQPEYYDARPTLEFTQSIWRNGFGREVRATQDLLEAQALVVSYAEGFRVTAALAQAEAAYWRLVIAREAVKVQRESLDRFTKMRDWNARRTNLNLTDRADLLQAEAGLQARKLDLKTAMDEEQSAARALNTIRGIDSNVVDANLSSLEFFRVHEIKPPTRKEFRQDVLAAQEQQRAAIANSIIGRERNSPAFELFANLSLNGRDADINPALKESVTGQYPWTVVGIRLSAPLDFSTLSETRKGYHLDIHAAGLSYARKVFEQEREWNDLSQKLEDAKKRLILANSVETAQHEKLLHEKTRHSRGRTTTFQVLLFEQDFANAQLAYLRAQAEILGLVAQMKTFGGTL